MALIELQLKGLDEAEVLSPGTPVPLALTTTLVSGFTLQWHDSNTAAILIKDNAGKVAMRLTGLCPTVSFVADDAEGDEDEVVWDLSKVFVDSTSAGQKVVISYYVLSSINYNK